MKKLIALVLALMLVLPAFAAAEEAALETAAVETETVKWEETLSNGALSSHVSEGAFVYLDKLGLTMWIPDGLKKQEAEDPVVYWFTDETGTYGMTVFLEEIEDVNTADRAALLSYIREYLDPEASASEINGLYCVNYTLGGEDLLQALLTFPAGEGRVLTFVFEPFSKEMNEDTVAVLLMSSSIMEIPAE